MGSGKDDEENNSNKNNNNDALSSIIKSQLASLDDTDSYASAWSEAVSSCSSSNRVEWGGRGKGGRGLSRRTYQPKDIIVPNVSLEYLNDPTNVGGCTTSSSSSSTTTLKKKGGNKSSGSSKLLLQNTTLKLLGGGHVYALVGRNGCGKSTLLRRMNAGKIPGFPLHLSRLYIPQEVLLASSSSSEEKEETPIKIVMRHGKHVSNIQKEEAQAKIQTLEQQLDNLDLETEENGDMKVEELCNQISQLEEDISSSSSSDDNDNNVTTTKQKAAAEEALLFFGVPSSKHNAPVSSLSGGLQKKVMLSCALYAQPDVLMLDEPTNHLDIGGILQLRRLIASCSSSFASSEEEEEEKIHTTKKTTIVLVSHDVDLLNDVSTDIIHFHSQSLHNYPHCNYRSFVKYRQQQLLYQTRANHKLEKQREGMVQTINNLKKSIQQQQQGGGSSGASERKKKKVQRAVNNRRKKLEKSGVERDEKGHRWTMQKACTGIKKGSINSIDASTRNKLSHSQLLKKCAETNVAPVPDKAVQFVFRDTTCTWGEPLIMAMDVGHGYGTNDIENNIDTSCTSNNNNSNNNEKFTITKKPGTLFDCVDLCIDEGSRTCILGSNGCGKSTLLRILAGREDPMEGKVHRAHNVNVGYFHQHIADQMIEDAWKGVVKVEDEDDGGGGNGNNDDEGGEKIIKGKSSSTSSKSKKEIITPLSLLTSLFPLKTEQDLRGELTSFGLNPQQATTNIQFLSGGERCRLCLVITMLKDPHVLILDEPTNHLDVESVEALLYGLQRWNGTVVLVSHDANLVRSIGGECFVIVEEEGKIRRIRDGIDSYLKSFTL